MTGSFKNDQAPAAIFRNKQPEKGGKSSRKTPPGVWCTQIIWKNIKVAFPKHRVPHSALGIYDTPVLRDSGVGLVHSDSMNEVWKQAS